MLNIEYYANELKKHDNIEESALFALDHGLNCTRANEYSLYPDFMKWLLKEREPLNEKEKEYLGNVVRPFRDKVLYIMKCRNVGSEFIRIEIDPTYKGLCEYIKLPLFKKNTMYKCMKLEVLYTLKELGL